MRLTTIEAISLPTSEDLRAWITAFEGTRDEIITNLQKYQGAEIGILTREVSTDTNKVNQRLAHDFRGEIVDQAVGYLFGKPATYALDAEAYGDAARENPAYQADNAEIDAFTLRADLADLDAETAKDMGNAGFGARLCYYDDEGLPTVQKVEPYEVIFLNTDEAIRLLQLTDPITSEAHWYVEFYNAMIHADYEEQSDGSFVEVMPPTPHLFDFCPLVEFVNNAERQNDWAKQESLIDAYDVTRSDAQNELEQFRQAYLVALGCTIDASTALAAKSTGAFSFPDGSDLKFVTKQINDTFLENHTRRLERDIYRFSKRVNMGDEQFSGAAMSGEARKWKLLALENAVAMKERKHSAATRTMFKVLASAWQKVGYTIAWQSIKWIYDRNVPIELTLEAQVNAQLAGLVSDETRLGLLSFIPDAQREIDKMEAEGAVSLEDEEEPPVVKNASTTP